MPTITITPEQHNALARGEDVTISAPKKPKEYLVRFLSGNVYHVVTTKEPVVGQMFYSDANHVAADCLMVRKVVGIATNRGDLNDSVGARISAVQEVTV